MTACPACAKQVDPLRAGHVAIFGERFFYFCDRSCRESYVRRERPEPGVIAAAIARGESPQRATTKNALSEAQAIEVTAPSQATSIPPPKPLVRRDAARETRLELGALVGGTLGFALVLAGSSGYVAVARIACSLLGLSILGVRLLRTDPDPTRLRAIAMLAPAFAAACVAIWSGLVRDPAADEAASFAGIVVATAAASLHLVERARRSLCEERLRACDESKRTLSFDEARRPDVHATIVRLGRSCAERGSIAALALAALAVSVNGQGVVLVILSAIAGYAAIATAAVVAVPALHVARGLLDGSLRGIAYRSAADWDRATEVSTAVFCARGTLLLGEPALTDLEALAGLDRLRVLSLAAGAHAVSHDPVAGALVHAASERGVRPDAVRSPTAHIGLGVTAIASTGERLVVGSRSLLLRERISVALAEPQIGEIETHGRTVLLVALGERLVGVIGLQDGLRPGARAAVQHLLDVQVEPVLLSGDSRETTEAIGRALDIEHVRPEILPSDRGVEIERIAEAGSVVAVLGHPENDGPALAAADLAVALSTPAGGDWAVAVETDDVRDGALAISLARRTRHEARTGLTLALAPGVVGALAVAFGLMPAVYAPVAALLGAAASTLYARTTDHAPDGAR